MKRTNIYLKARQLKELKRLSAETGATVAELVRRAVDEFTERRKAEKGRVRDHGEKKDNSENDG